MKFLKVVIFICLLVGFFILVNFVFGNLAKKGLGFNVSGLKINNLPKCENVSGFPFIHKGNRGYLQKYSTISENKLEITDFQNIKSLAQLEETLRKHNIDPENLKNLDQENFTLEDFKKALNLDQVCINLIQFPVPLWAFIINYLVLFVVVIAIVLVVFIPVSKALKTKKDIHGGENGSTDSTSQSTKK